MKTEEVVTAVLEGDANPLGSHAFLDEFALTYHQAVADRLRASPWQCWSMPAGTLTVGQRAMPSD